MGKFSRPDKCEKESKSERERQRKREFLLSVVLSLGIIIIINQLSWEKSVIVVSDIFLSRMWLSDVSPFPPSFLTFSFLERIQSEKTRVIEARTDCAFRNAPCTCMRV